MRTSVRKQATATRVAPNASRLHRMHEEAGRGRVWRGAEGPAAHAPPRTEDGRGQEGEQLQAFKNQSIIDRQVEVAIKLAKLDNLTKEQIGEIMREVSELPYPRARWLP